MKYAAITMVAIFFILTFFVIGMKHPDDTLEEKEIFNDEVRAVYVSYIELNSYIKNKSESVSKENINKILDNVLKNGFNTVILHVRPFADSIYKSDYFPVSETILNDKGNIPNYDVLKYFIDEAHKRNLRLEAWVNPFRISNVTDSTKLPVNSPYYKFANTNDAKVLDNGIYLNPASSDVQQLIINGIKEIITNYDVDGIHFDDYFYPDKTIDLKSFEEYQKNGGKLTIDEYRLYNVSNLIKNTYSMIKSINKNILFGIAPEGNIENNYDKNYIDVRKILSEEGYVDYIMPQIYYGFKNEYKPFIDTLNVWNNLIETDSIKLIPALAFYKVGVFDKYAGSGSNEWIEKFDIIKKQVLISRNVSKYGGFSLFRYDFIFNNEKYNDNSIKEFDNLKGIFGDKNKK